MQDEFPEGWGTGQTKTASVGEVWIFLKHHNSPKLAYS